MQVDHPPLTVHLMTARDPCIDPCIPRDALRPQRGQHTVGVDDLTVGDR